MTTPLAHGYADWTRYRAAAARTYLNTDFTDVAQLPSRTTLASFFVGDVPYIGTFGFANTGDVNIRFRFFDDDPFAGGNEVRRQGMTLAENNEWGRTIPVMAPFVLVDAGSSTAVNAFSLRVTETAVPFDLSNDPIGLETRIISGQSIGVAVGFPVTLNSTRVNPGPASWFLSIDPWGPVTVVLATYGGTGFGPFDVLRITNPCEQSMWGIFMLPAMSLTAELINNGEPGAPSITFVFGVWADINR